MGDELSLLLQELCKDDVATHIRLTQHYSSAGKFDYSRCEAVYMNHTVCVGEGEKALTHCLAQRKKQLFTESREWLTCVLQTAEVSLTWFLLPFLLPADLHVPPPSLPCLPLPHLLPRPLTPSPAKIRVPEGLAYPSGPHCPVPSPHHNIGPPVSAVPSQWSLRLSDGSCPAQVSIHSISGGPL